MQTARGGGGGGMGGNGGQAGIVKPFKQPAKMDETEAHHIAADLRKAINQIHERNASQLSFEELYRNSYKLVLHKHGEILYRNVQQELTRHASRIGKEVGRASDDVLLQRLVSHWDQHKTTLTMIRDILMYMDRTFVMQERKTPVYELGLVIFRDTVVRSGEVRPRLQRLLLEAVAAERRGESVDRTVLRAVLHMLVELGVGSRDVYAEEFEGQFLDATRRHYHEEARSLQAASSCPEYLRHAERRLDEERRRAQEYMDAETAPKVHELCADELIGGFAEALVRHEQSGLRVMLRDDKFDDVARMYKLLGHRQCREPMRLCLGEYVRDCGDRIMGGAGISGGPSGGASGAGGADAGEQDDVGDGDDDGLSSAATQERRPRRAASGAPAAAAAAAAGSSSAAPPQKPVDLVRELLALQSKCETLLRDALRDDKSFLKVLRQAFEAFMNETDRCAESLSLFLDDLLRNRQRAQAESDAELGTRVDAVVTLFRYLHDKDKFEGFYKLHLSKRLLSGRSVSEDAEMSVIKKLRSECGQAFTVKLENMFKDVKLSRETMDAFAAARRTRLGAAAAAPAAPGVPAATAAGADADAEPELRVTVLTSGLWPTEQAPPCALPRALDAVCETFRRYYTGRHEGRRLTWQTNLGSGEVKMLLPPRNGKPGAAHELVVSTYQMLALHQFNGARKLTFAALQVATQAPAAELKRHLVSLAAPRYRVLLRETASGGAEEETVYSVNDAFASKQYRVKVQLVSARPAGGHGGARGDGDGDGVMAHVQEARRHLMEAAIVRVMKTRKTLDHAQLVAEVTRQMAARFHPTPQDIKKRIESLLERDYLERDDKDHRVFRYVA